MAPLDIIAVIFLILMGFFIFSGNSLVFAAVLRDKKLQNKSNALILCLSAADLLVALFNIPLTIASIIQPEWRARQETLCLISAFFEMLFLVASVQSLGIIGVNRFYYIVHWKTYHQKFTVLRIAMLISGLWILSIILCIPPFIGWGQFGYKPTKNHCFVIWKSNESYTYFMVLACFMGPIVIMVICYYRIFRFNRRRQKRKFSWLKRGAAVELPGSQSELSSTENKPKLINYRTDIELNDNTEYTKQQTDSGKNIGESNQVKKTKVVSFSGCGLESNSQLTMGSDDNISNTQNAKFENQEHKEKYGTPTTVATILEDDDYEDVSKWIDYNNTNNELVDDAFYFEKVNTDRSVPIDTSEIKIQFVAKQLERVKKTHHSLAPKMSSQALVLSEFEVVNRLPYIEESESTDTTTQTAISTQDSLASDPANNDTPQPAKTVNARLNPVEENVKKRKHYSPQISKEERKLSLMLALMVVIFFIAWLPFVITMFIEFYTDIRIPNSLDRLALFVGYTNSLCNPILYGFMNQRFRKVYLEIWRRLVNVFCCKK